MRLVRWQFWTLVTVAAFLPLCLAGTAQGAPAQTNKVIIYPDAADSIDRLKQQGIKKVRDFGSYWIVDADDAQLESLRASHGARAVKADKLTRIELSAAQFDVREGEPALPGRLRESVPVGKRLRVVQLIGPVLPDWVELIRSAGKVKIVSYVPHNAYIVWLDQAAEDNLRQMIDPAGPIQWIGAYHPYYKIQNGLLRTDPKKQSSTVALRVSIVDGPEAQDTIRALHRYALGAASPAYEQYGKKIVQFTARLGDVEQIAQIANVMWIERLAGKQLFDEKQDLTLASQTNQLPGHAPIPANAGGLRYLDFLFDKVAGGLTQFTSSATYPIVDVADTGIDPAGSIFPDFFEFGDPTLPSRVAAELVDPGCPPFSDNFSGFEDFCGHGTFVASIVNGFSQLTNGMQQLCRGTTTERIITTECVTNSITIDCNPGTCPTIPVCCTNFLITCSQVTNFVTRVTTNTVISIGADNEGFQLGLGVSPFGLISSTRIFSQDLVVVSPCGFVIQPCLFCANSLEAVVFNEYLFNKARIANNSWGDVLADDGSNGGAYTGDSETYDVAVRDAVLIGTGDPVPGPSPLNQEMIIVFAGGNAGSVGNVGGFGDIVVTAPATAKNIIAVGSTENVRVANNGCLITADQDNSLDISSFSAFGPTLDGRFKPDVVAPGSSVYGALNQLTIVDIAPGPDCVPGPALAFPCVDPTTGAIGVREDSLYVCGAGTSFSAPAVSGGMQLLWWYFQNRLIMLQPSPAMARAYLANAARYLQFVNPITQTFDTLPSIAQGMGIMDLERMFDGVPRALRDETTPRAIDVTLLLTNTVPQQTYFTLSGQSYELSGQVFDATKPFRVTLAWTDVPGTPAANGALVNNLDLEVNVGGKTYRGNVFAGGNSVVDITRLPDSVNNMESIFLPPGQTGTWSAVVRATNIAGDGVPNVGSGIDQDYALVFYNTTTPSDVPNLSTNDTCQTAQFITNFPYTTTISLSSPTFHNNHPSPSVAQGGIEAFWTLGVPTQGTVFSINTFGSNFDTLLSVWSGQCGALVEVVANNNASNTQQSAVGFTANGTNAFFIVVDKKAGSGSSMVLNVTAVPPPITLSPNPLDFGEILLGNSSALMTMTYNNGTPSSVFIDSVLISGTDAASFEIFDEGCGGRTIASGETCDEIIVFTPTHVGTNLATITYTDSATGGPRVGTLIGIGLPPASVACLSTNQLGFPNTVIGFTSPPQSVTLTNCGTADLTITGYSFTGVASNEFSVSAETCTLSPILPNGTCTVNVVFSPLTNGFRTANMAIAGSATNLPLTVTLSGVADVPAPQVCIDPSSVVFGAQLVDTASPVQNITVTNCGQANLVITSPTIVGPNASDFSIVSNSCTNGPIAPDAICVSGVVFKPGLTNLANRVASLQFADNTPAGSHSVSLTGTASGSQPDTFIGKTVKPNKALGRGIINLTGDQQTLVQKVRRGKTRKFFIAFQNIGIDVDSFRVLGAGDSPGTNTVAYFLGSSNFGGITNQVTVTVESGTFATASLASGAITGDATLLRLEVTGSKSAPKATTNDVVITTSSTFDPTKQDVVRARVVIP